MLTRGEKKKKAQKHNNKKTPKKHQKHHKKNTKLFFCAYARKKQSFSWLSADEQETYESPLCAWRLQSSKRYCLTWLGSHFRALPVYIKRGCAALPSESAGEPSGTRRSTLDSALARELSNSSRRASLDRPEHREHSAAPADAIAAIATIVTRATPHSRAAPRPHARFDYRSAQSIWAEGFVRNSDDSQKTIQLNRTRTATFDDRIVTPHKISLTPLAFPTTVSCSRRDLEKSQHRRLSKRAEAEAYGLPCCSRHLADQLLTQLCETPCLAIGYARA